MEEKNPQGGRLILKFEVAGINLNLCDCLKLNKSFCYLA